MRKALLYPRLAARNLLRERRFTLPYLLTVIGTAAGCYIVTALSTAGSWGDQPRYIYLGVFMNIGVFVISLFAAIFLLYTNSFLSKRRQRELGLYNILGMGKGHIALVLTWETVYLALAGIGGGLLLGPGLQWLVTLAVSALMRVGEPFPFSLSPGAFLYTAALLGAILTVSLLTDLGRVRVQRPMELLRGSQAGEREPRVKWLPALLGVLSLGGGYAIALLTRSAAEAFALYFAAVILVIIGTYCLFTSLSILVLKLLRRNRKFYYKTTHFIGVSGMLYRMKRNAVGLANICVLCTMVLVTVSATLTLYLGAEDLIAQRRPLDGDAAAMAQWEEFARDFYALNGGFFFLGIFLALIFLMAAALMVYYKQISEGYEDQARYRILRNVGMEDRDIRRSVNSQMRVVFFAPLLTAGVHIAFDFPLVARLLSLFEIENTVLFLLCTLGTFGGVALLYLGVYRLTARACCRLLR